ncbi:glycosyltransferase [Xenorhabdus sp. SF857]|uniref:glycosyltransferase family 2 protein n=1 Tax=Xenorhabdus bakwenae TaxID=3026967 RepID=UPI0025582C42|nr:glycosyltransferase [Xenorhabdus sp. SF857]WFQ78871.1 glycosyltransferase [Xenorhabdus sp. SF857]
MIFVSICIPTKDRVEYLKETLMSIINDHENRSEYEIVVSDNSDNNKTMDYVLSLKESGINVVYYRNPVKGFYNSIEALKHGNGELLKLHNDYSKFRPGQFSRLVQQAKNNIKNKPVIFFSNGTLKLNCQVKSFDNKDDFIRTTSFQNTWSSAFSIWKEQLCNLKHSKDDVDVMFPHTSLLFNIDLGLYLIDNGEYIENLAVEKKEGIIFFIIFVYCIWKC